ncbi:MAG: ferredoxin:thioredoxin reductase [candidate division WOR-3 bacterium]|nr:MAG: ferredoxin:thioredoxin reductase [candidate division WOR-3 bacterium]
MSNPWDSVIGTGAYNKNLARIHALAAEKGYRVNPDTERIEKVVGLMTMNSTAHTAYYCPCKLNHPLDPQKDATCPCPELESEITKDGNCFCRLFFKQE